MKTREQLIEEIEKVRIDFATKPFPICSSKILDLIISVCEETIKESPEWAFENLKKLKSK